MLLRAIQERRYRPIGDKTDKSFNVRIIAATNEDLETAVNEKRMSVGATSLIRFMIT